MRLALAERDLSQSNLAHILGVSVTQISDWISGRHRPTKATRAMIATLLRVEEKWLTEGTGLIYKEGGGGEGRIREAEGAWRESNDPRWRLIAEVKQFALEADLEDDAEFIDALLANVRAFRKSVKRRRALKDK